MILIDMLSITLKIFIYTFKVSMKMPFIPFENHKYQLNDIVFVSWAIIK